MEIRRPFVKYLGMQTDMQEKEAIKKSLTYVTGHSSNRAIKGERSHEGL